MEPTNSAALFTVQELAIWVTVVSTTVGLIIAFGKFIREAIQARWQKRHDNESVGVELKKVAVSEKEAETHELSAIFEGFTQALTASGKRAENAEKAVESMHARLEKMEQWKNGMEKVKDEMISHIKVLESGYPNPPGPPQRPHWEL